MKGSISEFELGILRSRMLDAARSKARRGELRIPVPVGYVWHREVGLGLDSDRRVQEVTRRIFQGFRELGSARQVHLALKVEGVHFPRPSDGKRMTAFDWTPIRYRNGSVYCLGAVKPNPVPILLESTLGLARSTLEMSISPSPLRSSSQRCVEEVLAGRAGENWTSLKVGLWPAATSGWRVSVTSAT